MFSAKELNLQGPIGGENPMRQQRDDAPAQERGEDELPDDWEAFNTDEGETYYYNAVTGVTQWEKPPSRTSRFRPPTP